MFIFSSSCHLVYSYLPLSRTNKPSLVTKRTALFRETILTTKITSWHLISVTERSEFMRRDFFLSAGTYLCGLQHPQKKKKPAKFHATHRFLSTNDLTQHMLLLLPRKVFLTWTRYPWCPPVHLDSFSKRSDTCLDNYPPKLLALRGAWLPLCVSFCYRPKHKNGGEE